MDNITAKIDRFKHNNRKIKFTALKYLHEIAAISRDARERYRQKLLNCPISGSGRKNSANQKNVRLFEIINDCIDNDDMTKWNEDKICAELNISRNMLYCHKHYILKGLREFYFNWKEIAKKEIKKENSEGTIFNMDRALLMNEIGMKREAKSVFINICKTLESKKTRNINEELALLKANEKLCFYYYHQNNRHKFNVLYARIEEMGHSLLKRNYVRNNKFLVSEINIVLYHCLLKKLGYSINRQNIVPQIIKLCKKILSEARKTNNSDLICKMIINISSIYQDLMQFDKSLEFNRKGLLIAQKHKLKQEEINFNISIALDEFLLGRLNFTDCLNKMTELYKSIECNYLKDSVKERILYQFFCLGTVSNRNGILSGFTEDYYSHNTIVRGYKSSTRMLYHKKFTHFLSNIFQYDYNTIPNSAKKSIVVKDISVDITAKLDGLVTELLSVINKRQTVYFTLESYLFMLQTEFCKGKNMNYELFNAIYLKIKWILKTRSKMFQNDIDLHRLLLMFRTFSHVIEVSTYYSENELINKFEKDFDSFANRIYGESTENILQYFTFLSFTAEQSGCGKFKNISDKLYFKLDGKHPDIFSQIKRQIESKFNRRIPEHKLIPARQ